MAPRKNQPRNDRQDKILEFIRSEVERRGFPPSVREICDAMGIKSTSTVHGHLRRLENRGLLVRDPTKPRAIEVVGMQHRTAQIPLVGKAPAGVPITAVENVEETLAFSPGLFCSDEDACFALRVSGDSMINAGILSGDKVVVRPQQSADDGQIVVARIEDEATVKRLRRRSGQIWLMPENDNYSPIDGTNAEIIGIVKAVVREY